MHGIEELQPILWTNLEARVCLKVSNHARAIVAMVIPMHCHKLGLFLLLRDFNRAHSVLLLGLCSLTGMMQLFLA